MNSISSMPKQAFLIANGMQQSIQDIGDVIAIQEEMRVFSHQG